MKILILHLEYILFRQHKKLKLFKTKLIPTYYDNWENLIVRENEKIK